MTPRRTLLLIGGMALVWALAGLLGALLHGRVGVTLLGLIGQVWWHLPLREVGMWAIGGGLMGALLWVAFEGLRGRTAFAIAGVWALAGPVNWRPGPALEPFVIGRPVLAPFLDNDFAFYPVGVLVGIVLTVLLLRGDLPTFAGPPVLLAVGVWLAGHGLFSLLTGYAIPLYVLRAQIVNLWMGLLYGLLFGGAGGLGLWLAYRPSRRDRASFTRQNPLLAHLVRVRRGGLMVVVAVIVALWLLDAFLITRWGPILSARNAISYPMPLRRMPLLPLVGLMLPAVLMAAAGAGLTNASSQWMQLLPLAGMPRRQIAWSYTLAVLARMRLLLAVVVGLLPLAVWASTVLWRVTFYVRRGVGAGVVVGLVVVGVGVLLLYGLAAAVGVSLSLTRPPSPLLMTVAPLVFLALVALPALLLLTFQPLSVTRGLAEGGGALLLITLALALTRDLISAVDPPH